MISVITLIIGVVFAVLSAVSIVFEWTGLIAGYSLSHIENRKKLSRWYGFCLAGISVGCFLLSFVCYYFSSPNLDFASGIIFMLLIMFGMVTAIAGASKYIKL
jgi:hypothetical protein